MYCLLQDDGVDFKIQGRVVNFRETITVVAADNLASWNLGGYMTLSSATRKCRFCMATGTDMQVQVNCLTQYVYSVYNVVVVT